MTALRAVPELVDAFTFDAMLCAPILTTPCRWARTLSRPATILSRDRCETPM
jgi:hypothetical protein